MTAAILRKISSALFVFLLLFAPLAFGTVENWSYFVLETGARPVLPAALRFSGFGDARPVAVPGRVPPFPPARLHALAPAAPALALWSSYSHRQPLKYTDPFSNSIPEITSIPLTLNRRGTLLQLLTLSAYYPLLSADRSALLPGGLAETDSVRRGHAGDRHCGGGNSAKTDLDGDHLLVPGHAQHLAGRSMGLQQPFCRVHGNGLSPWPSPCFSIIGPGSNTIPPCGKNGWPS